jgi:hypothetical protein
MIGRSEVGSGELGPALQQFFPSQGFKTVILTGVQGRVLVGNDNNTAVKMVLRRLGLVLERAEARR